VRLEIVVFFEVEDPRTKFFREDLIMAWFKNLVLEDEERGGFCLTKYSDEAYFRTRTRMSRSWYLPAWSGNLCSQAARYRASFS
jgi:hypothetical protein